MPPAPPKPIAEEVKTIQLTSRAQLDMKVN